MKNINEENHLPTELPPRHPDEENKEPNDIPPRKKNEENDRPDEQTSKQDEENQIRSADVHRSWNKRQEASQAKTAKTYKPSQASKVSHAISGGLTVTAIVLVVAAVIVGNSYFKTAPTFTVTSLNYVNTTTENGISYQISVTANKDKIPLVLKATYTDNLGIVKETLSQDITEVKDYSGTLPVMTYYGVDYVTKIVRTDLNSERVLWKNTTSFQRAKTTAMYPFFWECHCSDTSGPAAGKAYYQLSFADDYSYWSNFRIRLTKKKDTTVTYTFACEKDYHAKHLVQTSDKEGGTYLAEVIADSTQDSAVSQETVILTQEISI